MTRSMTDMVEKPLKVGCIQSTIFEVGNQMVFSTNNVEHLLSFTIVSVTIVGNQNILLLSKYKTKFHVPSVGLFNFLL